MLLPVSLKVWIICLWFTTLCFIFRNIQLYRLRHLSTSMMYITKPTNVREFLDPIIYQNQFPMNRWITMNYCVSTSYESGWYSIWRSCDRESHDQALYRVYPVVFWWHGTLPPNRKSDHQLYYQNCWNIKIKIDEFLFNLWCWLCFHCHYGALVRQ